MLSSGSQRGFAKHRSHACFPALAIPNAHTCFATNALLATSRESFVRGSR